MSGGTYRLSQQAEKDVREIEDYTARTWGDSQAADYVEGLFEAFRQLADQPKRGRARPDVPAPYLVYGVGSHLVIYRHNLKEDRVEILNILHPAMDIKKRVLEALQRK